jgi:hypothetical protein
MKVIAAIVYRQDHQLQIWILYHLVEVEDRIEGTRIANPGVDLLPDSLTGGDPVSAGP